MGNENGVWIMHGVDETDPCCIHTSQQLVEYINKVGFLPLFKNDIEGFSVEEHTVADYWWSGDELRDPWEWRRILSESGKVAYGKFFDNKAGFISLPWLPYFINHRRDGYDFDSLWDDEKAPFKQKRIMDVLFSLGSDSVSENTNQNNPKAESVDINQNNPKAESVDINQNNPKAETANTFQMPCINENPKGIFSNQLKEKSGYGKGGEKNFEGVITALQMKMYVCVSNFEQRLNKKGEPYGWHIAVYSTPEEIWGYDFISSAYGESPQKSKDRIVEKVKSIYFQVTEKQLLKL